MKTKTINLYSFKELSEEAQQKAIENLYDLNVSYDWWESTFEDAKRIGLQITEFDLDRNRYAKGKLLETMVETARLIMIEHGENCETYKTAQSYLVERDNLVAKYSDGKNIEIVDDNRDDVYQFDEECDELDEKYFKLLLEDYSIILQKESEYLTSREAIIEGIEANGYTFTADGKLEN